MVKTSLVEEDFQRGRQLIEKLEQTGFPVSAALWFYMSESDEWRLFIASPIYDAEGPRATYTRVQRVLSPDSITLDNISVISPEDQLIRLLGQVIQTGPSMKGIRFTRNAIGGIFIEDAYIYKIDTVNSSVPVGAK
jgi:hypothetical protein